MKKCSSCNIQFNTSDKLCPLCQNILTGQSNEFLFPKNTYHKTKTLILKVLLFVSLVILLVFGFVELNGWGSFHISTYIGLGLITNYVIVNFIFKTYQKICKILGQYGIIITILLLIWYMGTGFKIIPNYIIPSVCIFELISNILLIVILRNNYLFRYSRQILMNIFLLLFPIVLVYFDITTNNMMSYICCLLSIISIFGLLIFCFDQIKDELKKLFNI